MKEKQKKILIVISILIILLIAIMMIVTSIPEEEPITEEQILEISTQKVENQKVNLLANKNEEERMRYYLSDFIQKIELKEYDKAYELLNSDFKSKYFKTYEEFESYVKEKFPSTISIKYDNFERAGDVYIFWITLTNPLTSSKDAGTEINVVIKENDLNDFEMSFSVI